jgi:cyclopropane fatty-acyl-phospholipid synthase-like methyltransferase
VSFSFLLFLFLFSSIFILFSSILIFLPHTLHLTEKGQKILDVGCGVGGPAREVARFSGAHVTGLNNNAYQVLTF